MALEAALSACAQVPGAHSSSSRQDSVIGKDKKVGTCSPGGHIVVESHLATKRAISRGEHEADFGGRMSADRVLEGAPLHPNLLVLVT